MHHNQCFICEICHEKKWRTLGGVVYERCDIHLQDEYTQKRLKVLFEVWLPETSSVIFHSIICTSCGFICHSPRAESSDIDAKYRAIGKMGRDYGVKENVQNIRERSKRLFALVKPLMGKVQGDVLDYGGGDGRLMDSFLRASLDCFLVDYNENPINGVDKIGDTLVSLDPGRKFAVIIANHVIEHVAEPGEVIKTLGGYLEEGGVLFVEVPLEVWKNAPLPKEPVTHINFFVVGSLARAFEEAGLSVILARRTTYLHPSGSILPCVQVAGRNAGKAHSTETLAAGYDEAMRHISPGITDRVSYEWACRETLPRKLSYKISRLVRRIRK